MLLVIDIGNSTINIGFFLKDKLMWRLKLPSHPYKTSNYYKNKIRAILSKNNVEIPIGGVIISSVVPELTGAVRESVKGLCKSAPRVVSASLKTGLQLDVRSPDEVGADRICEAVAAREIFGSPVLVADFGTATTISAVRGRRFIGGAILPGLRLMSDSLQRGTAKLPPVYIMSGESGRVAAVGKNTSMNIMSGILYGTAGATERVIGEIEREERCKFRVVITGGNSEIMTHYLRRAHCSDPDLTLKGLMLIHERNA